jgi:diguanylate cyclase (GGDEF)-like protein/PAS domain S-box-containing protein
MLQGIKIQYLSSKYVTEISELLIKIYTFAKPEHCFIARIGSLDTEISTTEVSTISYLKDGKLSENLKYMLTGTPCEVVINMGSMKCYTESVQKYFPLDLDLIHLNIEGYLGIPLRDNEQKVIGIFVCLFKSEIPDKDELTANCNSIIIDGFSRLIQKLPKINSPQITELVPPLPFDSNIQLANFSIDHIAEAIMITDINNEIIAVNQAMLDITGYTKEELIHRKPSILSSGLQNLAFYKKLWEKLLSKGLWRGELYNKRKDGRIYPEELSINVVRNDKGEISNFVGIFRDITSWKSLEEKLKLYADYDPLTGLPNRRSFIEKLVYVLSSKGLSNNTAIAFIDLDEFKIINDTYGHDVGDALLINVSSRISEIIDSKDILCRYGGDEFTLILNNYQQLEVLHSVIDRIMTSLRNTFNVFGLELNISASIGVATCIETNSDLVLRDANHAMNKAKKEGRNCVIYHNELIRYEYQRILGLKEELSVAITSGLLEVFYQPIVDIQSNKILKFEALARWRDSKGKSISPAEFIPIAEEYGLIHDLGAFILKQACVDLKSIHDRGFTDIVFSINRSIKEIVNERSDKHSILSIIESYDIPYNSIIVEITESTAMSDDKYTKSALSKLRNSGVRVALDDFCTGYSSLNYLIDYEIDLIKIDRSFVNNISKNVKNEILIRTILSLARQLNIEVVAEGVENIEQLKFLEAHQCNNAQGFYYNPAIPINECLSLLVEGYK